MRVLRTVLAVGVCALVASPALAVRDHYMCYKAKQTKDQPRFGKTDLTKKLYAALDDILDPNNTQDLDPNSVPGVSTTVQMKKVKDLCLPAALDGFAFEDVDTSYVMYQVKSQKGQCSGDAAIPCKEGKDEPCIEAAAGVCVGIPKFDKKDPQNTGVRLVDRYVDVRVDFAKEVMALVPSNADSGSFPGAPVGKEHFKCYSVKPAKSSCVGGDDDGETCKDSSTCGGGGSCVKNLKFPKETNPDGIFASFEDGVTPIFDGSDPEKALALSKLKMFCQATDKKLVGDGIELRNEQQAGLLCYAAKAAKAACDGGDNDNLPCKKDVDCPDGSCRVEPKLDKKDSAVIGTYVEDELFEHRLDINKEDMFCTTACRGYENFAFNDLVAHVTSLQFAPLDVGVNIDGLSTCAPSGCNPALGVDNQLGNALLSGIVNPLLAEQLDEGSINVMFQLEELVDGNVRIAGFLGELDATPGCAVGDANNPPIDPGNPSDPCNYIADLDGFTDGLRTTCTEDPLIALDVTLAGTGTTPSASASGGGPGSNFTLDIPLGDDTFTVTAQNVLVDATLTHDGSDISEITGVLGGGVNHALLVTAIASLPSECFGGTFDGEPCVSSATCGGGSCQLSDTVPFSSQDLALVVSGGIPPDLDLDPNDAPGTNPGCPACESVSLNLQFTATEAIITGASSIDN